MNHILYLYLERLNFRYATNGAKAKTSIKNADKIVFGIEEYSLVGFTVHIGPHATSGHYVAYLAETSERFDDLGGNQIDEYGEMIDNHDFVPRDQFAKEQEKGYIYLYKQVTNR